MKPKPITRIDAIKVINELFERYFGNDKGSGELFWEFMEDMGLCEYDYDTDTVITDSPSQDEVLLAMGVQPQELIDILHINPNCYTEEMCKAYKVDMPKSGEGS